MVDRLYHVVQTLVYMGKLKIPRRRPSVDVCPKPNKAVRVYRSGAGLRPPANRCECNEEIHSVALTGPCDLPNQVDPVRSPDKDQLSAFTGAFGLLC